MHVRVRACVSAFVRACVSARVRVCVRACKCACMHACLCPHTCTETDSLLDCEPGNHAVSTAGITLWHKSLHFVGTKHATMLPPFFSQHAICKTMCNMQCAMYNVTVVRYDPLVVGHRSTAANPERSDAHRAPEWPTALATQPDTDLSCPSAEHVNSDHCCSHSSRRPCSSGRWRDFEDELDRAAIRRSLPPTADHSGRAEHTRRRRLGDIFRCRRWKRG